MASKARRWFVGLCLSGAAIWAGSQWLGADDASPSDAVNRVWLERLPKNRRDIVGHLVLIDDSGQRYGAVGRSSTWRHEVEVFKWALERDRLMQLFPQTGNKTKSTLKASECDAPKPFELCLDIAGPKGKRRLYSRHDWVIEPGTRDAFPDDAELRGLVQLPAPSE
jgi:hypothetical protein